MGANFSLDSGSFGASSAETGVSGFAESSGSAGASVAVRVGVSAGFASGLLGSVFLGAIVSAYFWVSSVTGRLAR